MVATLVMIVCSTGQASCWAMSRGMPSIALPILQHSQALRGFQTVTIDDAFTGPHQTPRLLDQTDAKREQQVHPRRTMTHRTPADTTMCGPKHVRAPGLYHKLRHSGTARFRAC